VASDLLGANRLAIAILAYACITSPAGADQPWNGDVGSILGSTENTHYGDDGVITWGLGAALGYRSVYVEARYLDSRSSCQVNTGTTFPQYCSKLNSVDYGVLFSPKLRLSRFFSILPLVGAGETALHLRVEERKSSVAKANSSSDHAYGSYLKIGVGALLLEQIHVSGEYAWIKGTHLQVLGQPSSADHGQLMFMVSWRWGNPLKPEPRERRPRKHRGDS
jgi:hypothetical protein